MKLFSCLAVLAFLAASCGNNEGSSASRTFCDTACRSEPLQFRGDHPLEPVVTVLFKNCMADTFTWTHEALPSSRQLQHGTFFGESVRIHPSAVDCFIKDTSYAWVSYNDCESGRGYLLRLPFSKEGSIKKANTALNRFDPKFSLDKSMRAYASESTIYAVNVNTNKEETMSLQGNVLDFDNIHSTLDSINITPSRIYVRMTKEGKPVELQKQISL
jgi:hypothetical protein